MRTAIVALAIFAVLFPLIVYFAMRLRFEQWKAAHAKVIRLDAAQRSHAVTVGKVYEQLIPYLPEFRWNPRDVRFVGAPVDFLVFDGLSDGAVRAIVFVEVKTGQSALNTRERLVRDAVLRHRVEWSELRLPGVTREGGASLRGSTS
ncbi:MAG TPA: Holliday junction resolvase-like protein [Gemmatimonadales bacterium]|nr:Holliday junction resolvase-like protein [Gemmatimonadales bacterium]